jgi:excinuclease ABC subunit C
MLAVRLQFEPARDKGTFAATPAAPAVFLLRGSDGAAEPYVSKTANLRRRLVRLLGPAEERSRRLNLRERVASIEYSPTGSDFESGFLLYRLLRQTFPKTYAARLRLRFAPLVRLHLENAYPRASITTRMGRREGKSRYYGPFPSRSAAEKFAHDSLDFFKMRRCVDDLNPDPAFPGCIYSEMKMCLAPCFKGCTDEEYRTEVSRVQAYFDSGGRSLLRELEVERDQASVNLEFEAAATSHARVEKVAPVLGQLPEIVQRLDRLSALMVQRSAEPDSVALFRVSAGQISGPLHFAVQLAAEHAAKSRSMESRLEQRLGEFAPGQTCSTVETMEHLAILKRWYYRSSRAGEIFLADEKGQLPMRRIVRGIARVFRGEKPEPATIATSLSMRISSERHDSGGNYET